MTVPTSLALPAAWQGRERFTVLLDDFGTGAGVARLWALWQADPLRCGRLDLLAVARTPVAPDAWVAACAAEGLAAPIDWPPATPDLHSLSLADGRVNLLLACGPARAAWREFVAQVDAFHLAGTDIDLVAVPKALARLAAPDASVSAPHATEGLRAALQARGFALAASGQPLARYRPRFTPSRAPQRRIAPASASGHAIIIGAGIAGAATAAALARQGWRSTVFERGEAPAREGSGNPAGLFHGTLHPDDGPHARFNRVASFAAAHAVRDAIDRHGVQGAVGGLLRLEHSDTPPARMTALIARLGLGPDYVQALGAAAASRLSGLSLQQPAWFYPQGGWVHPAGLALSMLAQAGEACRMVCGVTVEHLVRENNEWQVLDAAGRCVGKAPVVVLANAQGALRLAGGAHWPVQSVRGQISMAAAPPGLRLPRLPMAGGGYVIAPPDGRVVFGATAQAGDADPALRAADHRHNLVQLERLIGQASGLEPGDLDGRTGWRCVTDDRLPLIGPVPEARSLTSPNPPKAEQARFVARQEGLYLLSGLGSRGITWAALGGQLVAAMITGAPAPLSASLVEAVDPARFGIRAARRTGTTGASPG